MRLKNVQAQVEKVLTERPESRDNDNILYLEIIKNIGRKTGVDVEKMSVAELFTNMYRYKFPPMESVRRARQKLQEKFPHLRSSEETQLFREMNEEEYLEYVRRKY